MKTINLPLTLFLLSIYINSVLLPSAAQQLAPVLDIGRNPLQAGSDYYVLPFVRGRGGGLTLASRGNRTCPLDVVQEFQEVDSGLPVSFMPVNSTGGVVRVSTDLNIQFSAATTCVQTTLWTLAQDSNLGQTFVSTGGVQGNPGRETISNWFRIEENANNDYRFFFCPTVCATCRPICRDVGIFILNGRRHLALSDVPFRVIFKRA